MSTNTEAAAPPVKAASSSLEEVEETVSRIASHKGVEAVLILSESGDIIESTFPEERLEERAKICLKIKALASLMFEKDDPVSFIRIRYSENEILLAPNEHYLLAVLHNPLVSSIDNKSGL